MNKYLNDFYCCFKYTSITIAISLIFIFPAFSAIEFDRPSNNSRLHAVVLGTLDEIVERGRGVHQYIFSDVEYLLGNSNRRSLILPVKTLKDSYVTGGFRALEEGQTYIIHVYIGAGGLSIGPDYETFNIVDDKVFGLNNQPVQNITPDGEVIYIDTIIRSPNIEQYLIRSEGGEDIVLSVTDDTTDESRNSFNDSDVISQSEFVSKFRSYVITGRSR